MTALARIPAVLQPYVPAWGLTLDQVNLIKRACCPPGTDDDQMALFFHECQRRGVHPMDRTIVMVLFNDRHAGGKKPVFIRTVDHLQAVGEESGELGGVDEPIYTDIVRDDTVTGKERPGVAKVNVYRVVKGRKRRFTGVARWSEFYPGPGDRGDRWRASPFHMLGKCARAQGFRLAFPKKLQHAYIREEIDRQAARGLVEEPEPETRTERSARAAEKRAAKGAKAKPPDVDVEASAVAGNPDHWTCVDLIEGELRGGKGRMWKVTCENGVGQRRDMLTRDAKMAAALGGLRQQGRVFEMTWNRDGRHDFIETLDPL